MTAHHHDTASLDAAVVAAEARVSALTADRDRHAVVMAGILDAITTARLDAERARGRRRLADLHALVNGG